MTELLPCPFCGGPAGTVGFEFITCLNADLGIRCAGKDIRVESDRPDQWNTRAPQLPACAPAAIMPAQSSAEYHQKRGVAWDIVDEAILAWNDFMLDDTYDYRTASKKIMERLIERRNWYHTEQIVLVGDRSVGDSICGVAPPVRSAAMTAEPMDLERVAKSLAGMLTEYVEGGINSNQNWRNGLNEIICARLRRLIAAGTNNTELRAVNLVASSSTDQAEQLLHSSGRNETEKSGHQPLSCSTASSAEPDAWQWRSYFNGRWGAWIELDQPIETFKARNTTMIGEGVYEIRPLYAAISAAPVSAWQDDHLGIVLSALRHLEEATGESFDDEGGDVAAIEREHNARALARNDRGG